MGRRIPQQVYHLTMLTILEACAGIRDEQLCQFKLRSLRETAAPIVCLCDWVRAIVCEDFLEMFCIFPAGYEISCDFQRDV